jgi:phytoene dehydrogenase-like protein
MYDTIIIGNDFSSLAAAITSVFHGKKTILISNGDLQDIRMECGYTFNVDPMPISGFGSDQIISRFLEEYGISFVNDSNLHLLNPGFQIIMPDHRIDLLHDIDEFVADLNRELISEGMEDNVFYSNLIKMGYITDSWLKEPPNVIKNNRKRFSIFFRNLSEMLKESILFSKRLKAIQKNPVLKLIIETELCLLSNYVAEKSTFFPSIIASILSTPHRGLYYYAGGKGVLMEVFKKIYTDSGGQIMNNVSITGIIPDNEIKVDFEGPDVITDIKGKHLILSAKSGKLPLLLKHKKLRRYGRRINKMEKQYHPFTLHIGVQDKGIPEKMAPYVALIVNEKKPLLEDNLVFLELSDPNDTLRAPANKRALSATIFLKESPLLISDCELEEKSKNILKILESLLPFLQENLDYLSVEESIKISRKYQDILNQKFKIRINPFVGADTLSGRTPLKNIYITAGTLLSGLGFEGEIISGRNAALATIREEK